MVFVPSVLVPLAIAEWPRRRNETGRGKRLRNILIKPVTYSLLFDTAVVALGADSEVTETAPGAVSLDVARIRGARVLLVEDNEINQEVAMWQLEDAALLVDLAENGEVAVQKVRDNDYDIVLMICRCRSWMELRLRASSVEPALPTAAYNRHDRQRDGLGPRAVPTSWHERSHCQANRPRPAVKRSAALDRTRRLSIVG